MIPYEVAVEFVEDGIIIDLTGAPEPQPGPVNAPRIGVISAIRCAMMALAIQDGGRANEGYFRPLQLKTRPGSMIDARRPAPVALGSYPLYILIEGINEAIASAMPDRRPGGYDMVVTLFMWGQDASDQMWIDSINICGGAPAAAPYGDGGGPLMPIACSGVRNISWEVWEAKTPMIVEQTEYATDSSGVGQHRGGPGMDVIVRALRPMDLTIVNERSQVPPFALAGGEKGRRNEVLIHRPDGSVTEYAKVTGTHLPEGSRIEMRLSGGAGVGPAGDRRAEQVHGDVAAGYLSEERARIAYPGAFA
jgi:N-methylhydantoinase B